MKTVTAILIVFFFCLAGTWAQNFDYTIHDRSEHDIRFEVPSGQNIHQIVLTVNSSTTISAFALSLDDGPAASEDISEAFLNIMDRDSGTPWNTNNTSGDQGKYISLYQTAGDSAGDTKYVLDIVEKPTSPPRGPVENPEIWTLHLSGFGTAGNTLKVTVGYRSASAVFGPPPYVPPGIPYKNPVDPLVQGLIVLNSPPIASFAVPISGGNPGEFNFDASGSSDPNTTVPADTIDEYRWTWGDGNSSTLGSATTTHTYTNPGKYTILLRAADNHGAVSDVFSRTIEYPPAITAFSFAAPPAAGVIDEGAKTIAVTVPYGTAVTALVASFTTTGAGVTVGGIPQTSGVTANNFTNPVAYTVTAADGSTAVYTVTVSAGPPSPPANLRIMSDPDPPHAASPAVLAFSCEFTPGSNPISLYSWNFGDGAAASGTAAGGYDAVEHTFVTGEYTVELTVTDSAGLQAAADVVVRALPDQVLSFPPHRGVPYNPNPPVVDGEIRPEEWRGTHRITYSTGAPPADLAFQGLKHRTENFLYLAFEVKKDRAFDPDDLVVLAFRPDAAAPVPADDRRIFIHPFAAGHTPGDNQNIAGIRIWKNSTGWPAELDPAAVAAVGIEGRITSFDFAGHKAWNLELKIPTSAASPDWVNFGDDFLFYFNVCKVDSVPPPPPAPQEPTVVQLSWPRGVPDVTGDYIAHDFDAAWWGRGDKSGTAVLKGVYVESADFGTTNSPPSKILLPAADPGSADNTFFARVKNDSERETAIPPDYSEPVAAEDVRVRFRIAAWGIPGPSDWRDLPATGGLDPAAPPGIALTPAQDIPAASGGAPGEAAFSLAWRIDRPGQDYTDYAGNTHQCMLVEIDSTAGANIKLRSQYRNMNFGYASEFSQPALISARGLGPPPAGAGAHTYLIVVTPRIGAPPSPPVPKTGLIAAQDPAGNPAGQGSVEWSAHGFLYTENHAVINGNSYRILEAAGSFGHLVTHIGETVDWEYELGGAEKIGENLYIVGVPRDGTAVVTPRIRPVEFRPNGVSLHAGSATPVGTSDYGTGFTVFADWERRFTRSFMALLLAGAAWFPEKAGGDPRWNLSVNVDGRWILPRRGSFRPYLQAGPGVYLDDSGGVDAGGNIGVGAWWELTSRLHGEFGIDAHTIPSAEFNFVAAHAGIAYKF